MAYNLTSEQNREKRKALKEKVNFIKETWGEKLVSDQQKRMVSQYEDHIDALYKISELESKIRRFVAFLAGEGGESPEAIKRKASDEFPDLIK